MSVDWHAAEADRLALEEADVFLGGGGGSGGSGAATGTVAGFPSSGTPSATSTQHPRSPSSPPADIDPAIAPPTAFFAWLAAAFFAAAALGTTRGVTAGAGWAAAATAAAAVVAVVLLPVRRFFIETIPTAILFSAT